MTLKNKLLKKFSKQTISKELLLKDEGENLEWLMENELCEYGNEKIIVDRAILKAISRRSNWVKILRFLYSHNERDFSCKEIHISIQMPYMTCHCALRKLTKSKVLQRICPYDIDKRAINFRISSLKVVEAILKLHDRLVSFKFARILPFNEELLISDLLKNTEFQKLCNKYKLTMNEAITALKTNQKFESIYSSKNGVEVLMGLRKK